MNDKQIVALWYSHGGTTLATVIQFARAVIEQHESERDGWIAVADALPDLDVPVLVLWNAGVWTMCRHDSGDDECCWAQYQFGPLNESESYMWDDDSSPSHWQALPKE